MKYFMMVLMTMSTRRKRKLKITEKKRKRKKETLSLKLRRGRVVPCTHLSTSLRNLPIYENLRILGLESIVLVPPPSRPLHCLLTVHDQRVHHALLLTHSPLKRTHTHQQLLLLLLRSTEEFPLQNNLSLPCRLSPI